MPMVRPMSGLTAAVQTWPLSDSIGVRQQYPLLCRDSLRYTPTMPILAQNLPDNPANIFLREKGPEKRFQTERRSHHAL